MPTVNIRTATYNVGPRESFLEAKIPWLSRRSRVVNAIRNIPGGPPGVLLLQECTEAQQWYITVKLGYESYGNGVLITGRTKRRLHADASGSNVVVAWNPADYVRTRTPVTVKGDYRGVVDYCAAVPLQRLGTGKVRWFASSHPTVGGSVATRIGQVKGQVVALLVKGVDLSRLIWGMDSNDTHPSDEPGVRAVLRDYGLQDAQTQTSPTAVLGATAHHFGRTSYRPRLGYRPIDFIASNPEQARARSVEVIRGDVKAADHYPVLVKWELI